MALRLGDMPTGFAAAKGHYVSNAEASAAVTPRRDYGKLGRINGYTVTYTKDGLVGLLQIKSEANLYRDGIHAHGSFRVGVQAAETSKSLHLRRLAVGATLGQEARLYKTTITEQGTKIDAYILGWRSGRIVSTLTAAAVAGTADPAALVALARKQQTRIAAATR